MKKFPIHTEIYAKSLHKVHVKNGVVEMDCVYCVAGDAPYPEEDSIPTGNNLGYN